MPEVFLSTFSSCYCFVIFFSTFGSTIALQRLSRPERKYSLFVFWSILYIRNVSFSFPSTAYLYSCLMYWHSCIRSTAGGRVGTAASPAASNSSTSECCTTQQEAALAQQPLLLLHHRGTPSRYSTPGCCTTGYVTPLHKPNLTFPMSLVSHCCTSPLLSDIEHLPTVRLGPNATLTRQFLVFSDNSWRGHATLGLAMSYLFLQDPGGYPGVHCENILPCPLYTEVKLSSNAFPTSTCSSFS